MGHPDDFFLAESSNPFFGKNLDVRHIMNNEMDWLRLEILNFLSRRL
jgi:hypothetical protein